MRTSLIALRLVVVAGVVPTTGCDGDSAQEWTHLGLDGVLVTAVLQSPWGLDVGTQFDGVQRLNAATGTFEQQGLDHAIVSDLVFTGGSPAKLFAGMRPYTTETTEAAVFASTDSGRTWTPSDDGLAASDGNRFWATRLAVDPADPQRMFFGEQFGVILRSTDGGETWQFVSGSLDGRSGNTTRIVVDDRTPGRVWVSGAGAFGDGRILRSDDGGSTWERITPFPRVEVGISDITLDPAAADRIWAAIGGAVIRSDDDGETWEFSLTGELSGLPVTLVFNGGDLYAVGTVLGDPERPSETEQLAILRLRRGDSEWARLNVPDNVKGGVRATFDTAGRLVVGTAGSGVWRLER